MKVLLIKSWDGETVNTTLADSIRRIEGIYPPLGIAYVAAVLEGNGDRVRIIDAHASNLTPGELAREMKAFSPDIVGVTATTPTLNGAIKALSISKRVLPDVPTVIGGSHLDTYPIETMSRKEVDYAIAGEGEVVMPELLQVVSGKKSPTKVNGLIYRKGAQVKRNNHGVAYVKDLDSLPIPARHLLPMDRYSSVITEGVFTTAISSRGCPFRCAYCFKKAADFKFRTRSVRLVADELEECVERYKVRSISFSDDTFTLSRERVREFCGEMIPRKLKLGWECMTRVDRVDKETLASMRKAGCSRIWIGIESGDPKILKSMNKRTTLGKVRRAASLVRASGIEALGLFMLGYIHETEEQMRSTIDFAKSLPLDFALFNPTTPYPKTPLYDQARAEGFIDHDYWAAFTKGETNERVPFFQEGAEEWTKRAYREFYMRPEIVLRRLSRLRSLSDLRNDFRCFFALVNYRFFSRTESAQGR